MRQHLILLFIIISVHAVSAQWEKCPGWKTPDPNIKKFIVADSNLLVLVNNKFFLSNDMGKSWAFRDTIDKLVIDAAAFDNKIFITSTLGVYYSSDTCKSWIMCSSGIVGAGTKSSDMSSIITNGNELIVGTYSSQIIYISSDTGKSWVSKSSGIDKNPDWGLAGLVAKNNKIWASYVNSFGTGQGSSYYSSDNGEHWAVTGLVSSDSKISGIYDDTIFAYTKSGLSKSTDNGSTWSLSNKGLAASIINTFATEGDNLFVGTSYGVCVSSDGGNNWITKSRGIEKNSVIGLNILGKTIIAFSVSDLNLSRDTAQTWDTIYHVNKINFGGTLSCSYSGNNLYVGSKTQLYVSLNDGESFDSLNVNKGISALCANENIVFAGTGSGLYKSTDYGKNWKNVIIDPSTSGFDYINAIHVDQDHIYVGTRHYLYFSTDNGSSWVHQIDSIMGNTLSGLATNGDYIFVGDDWGISTSSDRGKSWNEVYDPLGTATSLAVIGDNVFVGFSSSGSVNGVSRSGDNGKSWTYISNSGFPLNHIDQRDVLSLYELNGSLFVGLETNGIFQSDDLGVTWKDRNSGLYNYTINSFTSNDKYIFACTDGGVFRAKISDLIVSVNESSDNSKNPEIFPNPATDYINVENYIGWDCQIINLIGQEFYNGKLNNRFLSLKNINPGYYKLIFSRKDQVVCKSLLID